MGMLLSVRQRLALSAGMLAISMHSAAGAQDIAAEPVAPGEIIVTATKRAEGVTRTPMSISALTGESLEQQGIRNAQDLGRNVPALLITPVATGPGNGNGLDVSIRGVRSSVGAPTTGIYLDDAAIQRRAGQGANVGNGTVFPQLFDLERVEVLRGPQGTLYGGSSQGGTIRFITPRPSLTDFSGLARADVSSTKDGALSYEFGVAGGGPLIADRLGIRLSAWARHQGGYVDHVSRFTGETLEEDSNSQDTWALRGSLLAQLTDRLSVNPSVYVTREETRDTDILWDDVPQFTVPARTTGSYTMPAYTYGPMTMFGESYNTGRNCNIGDDFVGTVPECSRRTPRVSRMIVPSLSIEYELDGVDLKSVTSLVYDHNTGAVDTSFLDLYVLQGGAPFAFNVPLAQSDFSYRSKTDTISQEFRVSSSHPSAAFGWVAGLYFVRAVTDADAQSVGDYEVISRALRDQSLEESLRAPPLPGNVLQVREQDFTDTEIAGFVEASYLVTERLKAIGGLRVSRQKFEYAQSLYGPRTGANVATLENGGYAEGALKETPITPKLGLQYQIDSRNMLYATAAQGFRGGGINTPPPAVRCAADLAALGGSVPQTYKSDSLWSYEIGAKIRPVSAVQVNASAFIVDWTDVQVSYLLPGCLQSYITNGGKARSKGFDTQVRAAVGEHFSLNAEVAYTDARYTEELSSGPRLLIAKGDTLPVPAWTAVLGGEVSYEIGGAPAYLRADYQYSSAYKTGFGPGTFSHAPDVYEIGGTHHVSLRAGVEIEKWEAAFYVQNLLNSRDRLSQTGGRASCRNTECSDFGINVPVIEYTTFRPRTIGVALTRNF
jgi:outer membrane receptor protein involved in Fe transport